VQLINLINLLFTNSWLQAQAGSSSLASMLTTLTILLIVHEEQALVVY